eukprot:809486_1
MSRSRSVLPILCLMASQAQCFYIAHISDIHLDANYTIGAPSECIKSVFGLTCCLPGDIPKGFRNSAPAKAWGYPLCDTPRITTKGFFHAMRKFFLGDGKDLKPDFLMYTGDSTTHHDFGQNTALNVKVVKDAHKLMKKYVFTDLKVPILSSLGNHDSWPVDQGTTSPADSFNHEMANLVADDILSLAGNDRAEAKQAKDSLEKYGYYRIRRKIGGKVVRLIALNTTLWQANNAHVVFMSDPAGEFAWLRNELAGAKKLGEKVIISG